jgi:ABC-2 type transport system permease protein
MQQLREGLRMWRRLIGARIRSQLQYRVSFVLNTLASFALTFIDFAVVLALFSHFPQMDGWTLSEIALLYGISGVGIAVADLLVGHVGDVHVSIRSGQFDVVLLRPVGTLIQVISSDFALRRLGRIAQAAAVLTYALFAADISWNAGRVLLMPVAVAGAIVIFGATFILGGCLTFWTIGSSEVANAFTYGGNYMTGYPLNIFGVWLRRIFAFVVPLAFVTYFPGLYLLDKPDPLGFPQFFQFLAPVAAVAFAAAAGLVWRVAVRHYRSTGS